MEKVTKFDKREESESVRCASLVESHGARALPLMICWGKASGEGEHGNSTDGRKKLCSSLTRPRWKIGNTNITRVSPPIRQGRWTFLLPLEGEGKPHSLPCETTLI